MDSNETGDVPVNPEPGVAGPRPVALNRKLRRTLASLKRRTNRRLLREAYRELRMLRREKGHRPFETNAIEQAELEELA